MDQTQDFETYLFNKYPLIFSHEMISLEIEDGWQHIVECLCSSIQHYIDSRNRHIKHLTDNGSVKENIPNPIPQVTALQIKEKFGELRFYYTGGDGYISGLVDMAGNWSLNTCQVCGNMGTLRRGGWLRTLCDVHDNSN